MASKDENSTNRLFCDSWNGSRTPAFLKFKRDFSAGMGATFLHEDDYSLWQACTDADQGGQANGADPVVQRKGERAGILLAAHQQVAL